MTFNASFASNGFFTSVASFVTGAILVASVAATTGHLQTFLDALASALP